MLDTTTSPPWDVFAGTLIVPHGGTGSVVLGSFREPAIAERAVRAVNHEHALAGIPAVNIQQAEALRTIAKWLDGGTGLMDLAARNLALATLNIPASIPAPGHRLPVVNHFGVYQPDYWCDAHAALSRQVGPLREERDALREERDALKDQNEGLLARIAELEAQAQHIRSIGGDE